MLFLPGIQVLEKQQRCLGNTGESKEALFTYCITFDSRLKRKVIRDYFK